MFTEQILIFQEGLFVRGTDHNFPGSLAFSNIIEQICNFQGGTPLQTDNSEIGLTGCFCKSNVIIKASKIQSSITVRDFDEKTLQDKQNKNLF